VKRALIPKGRSHQNSLRQRQSPYDQESYGDSFRALVAIQWCIGRLGSFRRVEILNRQMWAFGTDSSITGWCSTDRSGRTSVTDSEDIMLPAARPTY